jgi:tRNA G18 (ribose-2'-O)-methylase SpoU
VPVIRIADPDDPRIAHYRNVPDPDLLRQGGLFIAENRLVVRALLASNRFRTRSVLVTDAALENLRDVLAPRQDDLTVYVCHLPLMQPIAGFNVHRGCLALGERRSVPTVRDWLGTGSAGAAAGTALRARRVVVLEGVTNADNMGGLFRTALAFGVEAVLLGPRCCDPLYRKSIRVSIGAALHLPFAYADEWPEDVRRLRQHGFVVMALTPAIDALDLEHAVRAPLPQRIALLAGNEGEGVSPQAQRLCDLRMRIPMVAGIDSLNVNIATAIALYRLMPG